MATTDKPAVEPVADVPDQPEPKPPGRKKRGHSTLYWFVFAGIVIVAAVLVVFLGWLPRHKRQQVIEQQAKERTQSIPKVQVLKVVPGPGISELMIPGTTLAYEEAYIYARASGYVIRRLVDIGDRVRAGQLLAVIDAPDLDKQVAQARANLEQSQSNLAQMEAQLHLAAVTWDRYKVLVAKGVFSRQDGDTQEANYRVAEANVRAAENTVQGNRENLGREIVLQQYERVTAPFSGVITDRNVDVGSLITAQGAGLGISTATTPGTTQSGAQGNNQGASGNVSSSVAPSTGGAQGGEMFAIANLDPLRILVSVPEAYSSLVQVNQRADLSFQELPQEKLAGAVARTSGSIDQNTRTLLVEVQVRNRKGLLMPGMYVVVNFLQLKAVPPLVVPGESIVVRNEKNTLAVVEDNYVHFKPVQLGRDFGNETQIVSGLKPGDVIVKTITDQVQEGVKIDPQFPQQQPPGQPQAGGQSDQAPGQAGRYGNQGLANQGSNAEKSKGGGKKGGGQKSNGQKSNQGSGKQ
ncbi:MAG TPA: efflux RND transporter periplasmic adaptor subunit [Bryobacteraceae bacterium]|jgi:multidrug efflux pump subunit AcrA (membrane-fusion protein)|nr:efflux RND transporter periplasmic adaptor subunit [Bryobacteraceae bacterium]